MNISLRTKLLIMTTAILLTACVAILIVGQWLLGDAVYEQKQQQTKELIDVGLNILEHYYALERGGVLNREEAQENARNAIRILRFGDQGLNYYWINDFHPRMLLHPLRPDLEGQDMTDYKGPDGDNFFLDIIDVCTREGRGHVSYQWQYYDNETRIEPKLSHVATFAPWQWILGTGVYVRDIENTLSMFTGILLMLSLAAIIVAVVLSVAFSHMITSPIARITRAAAGIAAGNYHQTVEESGCAEVASLSKTITAMGAALDTTIADLRASESMFRSITENAHDLIALLDLNGCFVYCNQSYIAILGYHPEELLGQCAFDLVFPEDKMEAMARLQEGVAVHKRTDQIVLRMVCKDNSIKWIENRAKLLTNEQDEPHLVLILARDISAHKAAEEALQIKTEELERYFNSSLDMLCIADLDGFFRRTNPQWHRTLGYLAAELDGQCFLDFVHPDDIKATKAAMAILAEGGEAMNFVNRYRHKDGGYRWIEWRSHAEGNTVYAAAQDVTDRIQMEEQLRQAQKMESVGRLAGGVAHDFNNMLQSILGYTELALYNESADKELREYIMEIQKAAQRSADLTNQLLAFARKQTVRPRVIDLNSAVSGMIKMLRRLIGEDINLIFNPGADLWKVKIDPVQVDQILANLAINARDAIAGVGVLTIELANVSLDTSYCADHVGFIPGDYVMLAVSDTGAGMDKETLSHLFEPFFTTKGLGKGTGLGLATIYGIIKQNQGFVNVYSEPGRGATFKVYLPREYSEATKSREQPVSTSTQGTETVLLVEDDATILNLGKKILERHGYTVLAASTPVMAYAMAAEYHGTIQIVVTDVVMPEMNGRELAEKIRLLFPEIKVLFMSGYTANIIAHHGIVEDDIAFLSKPFSAASLTGKVRGLLDE